MTHKFIATFAATCALACGLIGCAYRGAMISGPSQTAPANHVRILPNTAVVVCRRNGPVCEPPMTTSQGNLSGSVDAFGNVSINDPAGLPSR